MKTTLTLLKKDYFLVLSVDGKELGTVQRFGRNSAWNATFGIGRAATHVGNTYDKATAVLMAADGVVRACPKGDK